MRTRTPKGRRPRKAPSEFQERIRLRIQKADYAGALAIANDWRRRSPGSFDAEERYAAILGDYAEFCTPAKKAKLKRECIHILRGLMRRLRGRDQSSITHLKNEYYWQTQNHRAQYQLGIDRVRRGDKRGYYSQGVGAAWHAKVLAEHGHSSRARSWARRSEAAWKRYLDFRGDYYNAYTHLALAIGILGRASEAERSLQRAARLSGRPTSFREFEEIRELLRSLSPPT